MKVPVPIVIAILATFVCTDAASSKKGFKKLKKVQGCTGSTCQFDISDLRGGDLTDIEDIEIEIGEGVTRTFKQTRQSQRYMFHGESGLASMDLVARELETRGPGPNSTLYFGSMSDEENVYQIGPDEFGITQVTVTPWADVPPETDPIVPPREPVVQTRKLKNVKRKLSKVVRAKPLFEFDEQGYRRKLVTDNGDVIDVMVVWTRDAECARVSKPVNCQITSATTEGMLGLIELAVEETNVAYTLSGINTQLRLVHAYRDETYVEPTTERKQATTALADITYDDDGHMDDVHKIRDEYGADAVALIVAGRKDGGICGTAWVGPRDNFMFSVTNWACTTGIFSFGHEIGHNMGCQHDRGQNGNCVDTDQYGYGWRDPQARFRTILAYFCTPNQCDNNRGGGCPRIQRFSTPREMFKYDGTNLAPLGDEHSDCARRINDVASEIAGYRTAVECENNSDCNDNNSCTVDTCDNFTGQCSHSNTCVDTKAPQPTPPPQPTLPPPTAVETLFTTFESGNGQAGNMFEIDVAADVEIVGFDIHTRLIADIDALVFTRQGHYRFDNKDGLWSLIQVVTVKGRGEFELTELPELSNPVKVPKGAKQAFYITLPVASNELRYTDGPEGSEGTVFVSDGTVSVSVGRGVEYPFSTTFPSRIYNGNIKYRAETDTSAGQNTEPPTPGPTPLPTPGPTPLPTLRPTPLSASLPTPPPTARPTSPPAPSEAVSTLFTTDAAGNGQAGCMFELSVTADVEIVGFDIHTSLTTETVVEVWTRSGNYVRNNADGMWSLAQVIPVVGNGEGIFTELPLFSDPVTIKSGGKQAFYITLPVKTNDLRYTVESSGSEGQVYTTDGIVSFHVGAGVEYSFGRSYPSRVFNGNIKYKIGSGDPFSPAVEATAPPSIISSPSSMPPSPSPTANSNPQPIGSSAVEAAEKSSVSPAMGHQLVGYALSFCMVLFMFIF